MSRNLGIIRTAAVTPKLKIGNPQYNSEQIIDCYKAMLEQKVELIVFPELATTGYTCGDLFYQPALYEQSLESLREIVEATKGNNAVLVMGAPLRVENNYYNCSLMIQDGCIKGITPKMFIPNAKEYYEERWFVSGVEISKTRKHVTLFGQTIPFGHLLFNDEANEITIGMEVCEDLWMPITPGSHLALAGAHIITNTSASNEMVGKSDYRKQLVNQSSASNVCGYIYASSGVHESTQDIVFGGDCIISENGVMLNASKRFERENTVTYGEIDIERIKFERLHGHTFERCASAYIDRSMYQNVKINAFDCIQKDEDFVNRKYDKNPFVPSNASNVNERCEEIFNIQAAGLAKRLEHTKSGKVVIGISGGLDSTLALLVCYETFKLLGKDMKDIVTVTMPGFGTTDRTYNNAKHLMEQLGTTIREISIASAVKLHFEDIGHDFDVHDITYENAQARERTQILMDLANQVGGIVIGTGDLSEGALGWCTYNADHMSMYAVNVSIPKTLVRFVIEWVMENRFENETLKSTLKNVLDTPISPELLPPDEAGEIAQKTEETVGPYVLHDFFLYYTIRQGMRPEKLLEIARRTFADEYDQKTIKEWLKLFYRRFFSQQFKRSCVPDGPKVGSVSLSPRGDWRMPSDGDSSIWINRLDEE